MSGTIPWADPELCETGESRVKTRKQSEDLHASSPHALTGCAVVVSALISL